MKYVRLFLFYRRTYGFPLRTCYYLTLEKWVKDHE